jgi:beta-glucanase (GH16 family)
MSELIFSDDFKYEGRPDPNKWSFMLGYSKVNDEKQFYTEDHKNCRVESGKLIIEGNFQKPDLYTSARINTKGKFSFKHGKIDVVAKMPSGKGTWPAIWMLPAHSVFGPWPKSGEIDIVEFAGKNPGEVFCSNHRADRQQYSSLIKLDDCSESFHKYTLQWHEHQLDGYIDDQFMYCYHDPKKGWQSWPFNAEFFLIINMAIGGTIGGPIDNTIFPTRFEISSIKVYSL